METNLKLYIDNSREIYLTTEWLANCVAKKMVKGQEVTIEHLATCSTMKAIIRAAKNMIKNFGEEMPSKEECKEVAFKHAQYIIEDFAPFLVENYKPKQRTKKDTGKTVSAEMVNGANIIYKDYTGTEERRTETIETRKTA